MNHHLAPHWEAFISEQIKAGRFGTDAEVIEEALRLLERREAKRIALCALIDEGENSGEPEPLDMESIKRTACAEWKAERRAEG